MSEDSREFEQELWQRYWDCKASGDKHATRVARDKLVEHYIREGSFVWRLAKKMINFSAIKQEDQDSDRVGLVQGSTLVGLINDGVFSLVNRSEGLLYAVEHYDGRILFEAYAYDLVKWSMLHGVTIDPGQKQNIRRLVQEYIDNWRRFTNENQREPRSLQELADFAKMSLRSMENRQDAYYFLYPESLIEPDEEPFEEGAGGRLPPRGTSGLMMTAPEPLSPEAALLKKLEEELLWQGMVKALTPQKFQVLKMSFWDDMSDEEIAAILKTSKGNVRVLRTRAIHDLFDYFTKKGLL